MDIPQDYLEFLHWFKEQTEEFWSVEPTISNNNLVCEEWIFGAKWIGMTDKEIAEAERKYSITFPDDYKEFLKVLHTVDKISTEHSFFYNWNTDNNELENAQKWAYESLLQSVLNDKIWLASFGKKPQSINNRKNVFNEWYNNAPKLIPFLGHRYLVSQSIREANPIISLHGFDTIVYGCNIRHYLLHELQDEIGLSEIVYDETGWSIEPSNQFLELNSAEINKMELSSIPYWGELLDFNGLNKR
ncbi:SMI1/KNR4 family protein [Flammeovirga sp. SJP92]|uniref:SMI1/KNR4 family protein n=1 Tax=Flammeovirga sp. SJP92 TaxID=1775430 RepID=UPI000786FCB8|nr:SMI1/KNR4 family protein [Flammeovirga sp. SJP92]KXX66801.1 hypothetical protein AVL50_30170 [Flammeovirga sp. SJP92]